MSVIQIKSEDFEPLVTEHSLVFLDFWAPWCAPCLAFSKVYEAVSETYPDIVFAKLNVEESPELSTSLEVRSIPHLLIIKKSMIIYSESGSMPSARLKELAEKAIQVDVS